MCLILIGFRQHANYPVVIAANRDEFYGRPTAVAAAWDDAPEVFGGRDLQAHGTWFAVSRAGRFAAVTNYREPGQVKHGERSRGLLVTDFLRGTETPLAFVEQLARHGARYSGFNLLVGSAQALAYYSNRDSQSPHSLDAGIYGLSNHLLDTPWPKVERGKARLKGVLAGPSIATGELLELLADRTPADDERLPRTGVELTLERQLSPIFIRGETYGTRCSSICLIQRSGSAQFVEHSFSQTAEITSIVAQEFELTGAQP